MVATDDRTVTVFGGTGFLGRRVVRHLRSHGFPVRTASRHPDRGHRLFGPDDPQLQSVGANVHDERSVADALPAPTAVVNAVSLYVEHGGETFHSVHVEAAQRVAAQALRAGVDRLIHISGIGADAASQSRYIRKRGEGELAVRAAFGDALFVRPAVMFGPDDAFLTTIPQAPSPASSLSDVRPRPDQIAAGLCGGCCGGDWLDRAASGDAFNDLRVRRPSHSTRYEEFLRTVAHQAELVPRLIPIPFAIWHALAWTSEIFPRPLLTRNQVELMQIDTVSSPEMPGFIELGISPHSVEAILQKMLSNCG